MKLDLKMCVAAGLAIAAIALIVSRVKKSDSPIGNSKITDHSLPTGHSSVARKVPTEGEIERVAQAAFYAWRIMKLDESMLKSQEEILRSARLPGDAAFQAKKYEEQEKSVTMSREKFWKAQKALRAAEAANGSCEFADGMALLDSKYESMKQELRKLDREATIARISGQDTTPIERRLQLVRSFEEKILQMDWTVGMAGGPEYPSPQR